MFCCILNPEVVDPTHGLPELLPFSQLSRFQGLPPTKIKAACGKQHFLLYAAKMAFGFGNDWYDQLLQKEVAESFSSGEESEEEGGVAWKSSLHRYTKGVTAKVDGISAVFACGDQSFALLNDRRTVVARGSIYLKNCISFPVVIRSVACGKSHIIAQSKAKQVYGWGSNANGQLGKSSQLGVQVDDVVHLTEQGEIEHIGANYNLSVLIKMSSKATVSLTLGGKKRELLHGRRRKLPHAKRIVQVACGDDHILVLFADGKVWAWGSNQYGQLGLTSIQKPTDDRASPGSVCSRFSPVRTEFFVSVAAGKRHSLAVTSNGEVYLWGWCPPRDCSHQPMKVFSRKDRVKGKQAVCVNAFAGEDYSVLLLRQI